MYGRWVQNKYFNQITTQPTYCATQLNRSKFLPLSGGSQSVQDSTSPTNCSLEQGGNRWQHGIAWKRSCIKARTDDSFRSIRPGHQQVQSPTGRIQEGSSLAKYASKGSYRVGILPHVKFRGQTRTWCEEDRPGCSPSSRRSGGKTSEATEKQTNYASANSLRRLKAARARKI